MIAVAGAGVSSVVAALRAKRKQAEVAKVLQPIAAGSLTLGELIHSVSINEQELIERVAKFEADGLLTRVQQPRGRVVLVLTEAGVARLEESGRPSTF